MSKWEPDKVESYPKHYQQVVEMAHRDAVFEVRFDTRKAALKAKEHFNRYLVSIDRWAPNTVLGVQASYLIVAVMDRDHFVVANKAKIPVMMWAEMSTLNRTAGGKRMHRK